MIAALRQPNARNAGKRLPSPSLRPQKRTQISNKQSVGKHKRLEESQTLGFVLCAATLRADCVNAPPLHLQLVGTPSTLLLVWHSQFSSEDEEPFFPRLSVVLVKSALKSTAKSWHRKENRGICISAECISVRQQHAKPGPTLLANVSILKPSRLGARHYTALAGGSTTLWTLLQFPL